MATLLDEKHRPIPVCNIVDEKSGNNIYVSDISDYNQITKKYKSYTYMMMILGIILCLFLCIFSLNFGVSGWSIGNLVTFFLIIGLLFCAYCIGKEYIESQSLINKIQSEGVPCFTKKDENANEQIVHCSINGTRFGMGGMTEM